MRRLCSSRPVSYLKGAPEVLLGLAPLGLEQALWVLGAVILTWVVAALTARWFRQHPD